MVAGIRDRTLEFQKKAMDSEIIEKESKSFLRKFKRKKKTEDSSDVNSNIDEFLQNVERIKENIRKIEEICKIVIAQSKTFSASPFQENRGKEEIDANMFQIQILSQSTHRQLKELSTKVENKEKSEVTSATGRIQKTQYASLAKEFNQVMIDYQLEIASYRDGCLAKIMKRLEITGSTKSADEVEDLLEDGNWSIFTDGLLMETQKAKDELNQIQDRYKYFLQIEKSVADMNELFLQMALLVQEQGETIDSIERHVETALQDTGKAEEELKSARKSQRKARKRKFILISGGVIVVVVVILVIAL